VAALTYPRRVASTATTLTVSAVASTALEVAAATTGFDSNEFLAFHGQTSLTTQYGLSYLQNHPNSNIPCDPTEDGAQYEGHVCIDWAAKGCYDTQSKRVMWASCGAGNNVAGGYVYNTMPFYDETLNRWTVSRAFRGADESTSANPIVHMYDGNAIDVARRRFYRKKFESRVIMVYDLDTNTWLNNLTYTGGEPTAYGYDVGMDVVPSTGKLWLRGYLNGSEIVAVWEVDPQNPGGAARTVVSGSPLGTYSNGSVCCYNPRAFSGVGGMFVGGQNGAIIRIDTEAVSNSLSTIPPNNGNFLWAHKAHLCRDPVGDGWLYANQNGYMYRLTSAGTWTQRAQLPGGLATPDSGWAFVMVPIDHLGVVWIIAQRTIGPTRAWLYKP
jgi:hypothetical protein